MAYFVVKNISEKKLDSYTIRQERKLHQDRIPLAQARPELRLLAFLTEEAAAAEVDKLRGIGVEAAKVSLAQVHLLVDSIDNYRIEVGETDLKCVSALEALLDDRDMLTFKSRVAFAKERLAEAVWVGDLVQQANDLDAIAKAMGETNSDTWEVTRWSIWDNNCADDAPEDAPEEVIALFGEDYVVVCDDDETDGVRWAYFPVKDWDRHYPPQE